MQQTSYQKVVLEAQIQQNLALTTPLSDILLMLFWDSMFPDIAIKEIESNRAGMKNLVQGSSASS